MLEESRRRLLAALPEEAVVLDVGGWADPLGRADWVIDLMPWETRGLYARNGWVAARREPERFTRRTWIVRDLCDREPFPFADGTVDFAVCSHTLEDLRDPVWVCQELSRVARAGYVEVPSRLEEQAWGVNGEFAGWSHHRWLIDREADGLVFTGKLHALHAHPEWQFPRALWESLPSAERVLSVWWEGRLGARERLLLDDEQADAYLRSYVEAELARRPEFSSPGPAGRGGARRRRRRAPAAPGG